MIKYITTERCRVVSLINADLTSDLHLGHDLRWLVTHSTLFNSLQTVKSAVGHAPTAIHFAIMSVGLVGCRRLSGMVASQAALTDVTSQHFTKSIVP